MKVRYRFVSMALALSLTLAVGAGENAASSPGVDKNAQGELQPIKLELPPPSFGGTPLFYSSSNFEDPPLRARPPFLAPKGTELISLNKPVTSSDATPRVGNLSMITDGKIGYQQNYVVELKSGLQWVQIDLEKPAAIYAIVVWHFYAADRVYFKVVVQVSDDPAFTKGVTTVYNNDADNSAGFGVGKDKEYVERNEGRLIDAKGVKGRYVRLYSKGNTTDDLNHYLEVEVFGKT